MDFIESSAVEERFKLDELRLVHARRDLASVTIDEGWNAVIGKSNRGDKPFENTVHFTLNAMVRPHMLGKHFDQCHCVIISPFVDTVNLGNPPEGLLAADTYFHRDENRTVKVASPTIFVPHGMDVPEGFERFVQRYPRGINDQETEMFKIKAVSDFFRELELPFYDVNNDDWIQNSDQNRRYKLRDMLGLPEDTSLGRHLHSTSGDFSSLMTYFYSNLEKFRGGVRYVKDGYGRDVPISDQLKEDRGRLNEFIESSRVQASPPNAQAFYRRVAGAYFAALDTAIVPIPAPAA